MSSTENLSKSKLKSIENVCNPQKQFTRNIGHIIFYKHKL